MLGIEVGRVLRSVVPVSWIRSVALKCRSDVTWVKLLMFALRVRSCRASRSILSERKDDWDLMERYDLVGWMKPYNRFHLVKAVDDWHCELDLERRQSTIFKVCRYIGWHNLEVFALFGLECSNFYAVVLESWS